MPLVRQHRVSGFCLFVCFKEQAQQGCGARSYKHVFTWGEPTTHLPTSDLPASLVSVTGRSMIQWGLESPATGALHFLITVPPWPSSLQLWYPQKCNIICIWGLEFSSIYPFLFPLQLQSFRPCDFFLMNPVRSIFLIQNSVSLQCLQKSSDSPLSTESNPDIFIWYSKSLQISLNTVF